jgi:hypothetical protein
VSGSTDAIDNAYIDGLTGLELCPFSLAFRDDLRPAPRLWGVRSKRSASGSGGLEKLLTFAARWFQWFDFV